DQPRRRVCVPPRRHESPNAAVHGRHAPVGRPPRLRRRQSPHLPRRPESDRRHGPDVARPATGSAEHHHPRDGLRVRTADVDSTLWQGRVDALAGATVADGLDRLGCAPAGRVLDNAECAALADLYDDRARFRSTIDMARHRFGEGQYRYFDYPLPEPVTELRHAFWPRLVPIARAWSAKLGRPAPWPDRLDDWLAPCPPARQGGPAPRRPPSR